MADAPVLSADARDRQAGSSWTARGGAESCLSRRQPHSLRPSSFRMTSHSAPPTRPVFKFFRTGGLDQVLFETAQDLLALHELDKKLWVALSCPVKGLELDEATLALVDADGDGHLHVDEVIAAVNWAAAHLKRPADLLA